MVDLRAVRVRQRRGEGFLILVLAIIGLSLAAHVLGRGSADGKGGPRGTG